MELFDKKFVHFMWDDELEGKKGFVANYINDLKLAVNQGYWTKYGTLHKGGDAYPFRTIVDERWCLCYYDPNYEVKKAFKEGEKIQYRVKGFVDWEDSTNQNPCWDDEDREWRVKPEEEKWIVYLDRSHDYLTACLEYRWESVQKQYHAKTKLFVGTESEVTEWYESRQKFVEAIKAWEDGKTIQVYETLFKTWGDCAGTLEWYTDCEYRVKPDCPYADGIDSKACAGCPQDEARKQTFRPFKNCDELVAFWSINYQTGFRPANTKPLIWVRLKVDKRERLIVAFGKGFGTDFVEIGNKAKAVPLQKLFDDYEFLDGSPVGMEVKE